MNFSELQQDALKEVFNIGISKATQQVSSLVRDDIVINVSNISLISQAEVLKKIRFREEEPVICVAQSFSGDLLGDISLFFTDDESKKLIASLIGASEEKESDITQLEPTAVLELGNIIISGTLATLEMIFESKLQAKMPVYADGECQNKIIDENKPVFFIKSVLHATSRNVAGAIFLQLRTSSIEAIQNMIDAKFLDSAGEV